MKIHTRAALVATLSSCAMAFAAVPAAQADALSRLPNNCPGETTDQTFAQFGDDNDYTAVPGGNFEPASPSWINTDGAGPVAGNESFNVGGPDDSTAMSLPDGSSTTSPAVCASISKPTMRFFARNTGSPSARLNVDVYYPGPYGGIRSARVGSITADSSWAPTREVQLGVVNLLATLSTSKTVIAFRFSPADSRGEWTIDDVYVDPRCR